MASAYKTLGQVCRSLRMRCRSASGGPIHQTEIGSCRSGRRNAQHRKQVRPVRTHQHLEAVISELDAITKGEGMRDPEKLSHEELLVEIERLAILFLGTRSMEFRKQWQQCEDERKRREKSIWYWFTR